MNAAFSSRCQHLLPDVMGGLAFEAEVSARNEERQAYLTV